MKYVEVFGLERPGQIYEMSDDRIEDFVEALRERDTDFYEVFDTSPINRLYPDMKHITAGRDGRGTETTLCGIVVEWAAGTLPIHDEWCPVCVDRDA